MIKKSLHPRAVLLLGLACSLAACTPQATVSQGPKPKGQQAILEAPQRPKIARGIGWWPDVLFDQQDIPHIAYCDADKGKLRYATRRNNVWAVEMPIPKGNVGKYPAIAVSKEGVVYIGYYDQDKKKYALAVKTASGWNTEIVARGLEIGMGASVAIDAKGLVNLFFYTANGRYLHARRLAENQYEKSKLFDAIGGFSVRTAVSLHGNELWLSFIDSRFRDTSLRFARIGADGEHLGDVEMVQKGRGPGWYSGIGERAGAPEIIYSRSIDETIESTTKEKDGEWSMIKLATSAGVMAAEQNTQGEWTIAFQAFSRELTGGTLSILRGSGMNYEHQVIDANPNLAHYLDLDLNSKGEVLLAYFDGQLRGLKVYDESASAAVQIIKAKNEVEEMDEKQTQSPKIEKAKP